MTINLPEELARFLGSEVRNGQFASEEEAIAEAVRLLLRERNGTSSEPEPPATGEPTDTCTQKTIWEEIQEITSGIPEEEFLKLPVDGAEQHDHYIYGTPKRLATQ